MLGTFRVVTLAGGVLRASGGWRPLLNGLQCPGWPRDREWSSSNVNSAQAENPALDPSHVPSVLCSDLPRLPPRTEDSQVLTAAMRPCRPCPIASPPSLCGLQDTSSSLRASVPPTTVSVKCHFLWEASLTSLFTVCPSLILSAFSLPGTWP